MSSIIAALIWGVVNATMVCKTSGNPFAHYHSAKEN